jgi:hypothetical protein
MKKLDLDIFLFESILPNELCEKLYTLKFGVTEFIRIELFDSSKELFYEFNKFWFENIENQYLDEYLKVYKPEEGIGFSAGNDAVKFLKEYLKTKWRDLYLFAYDETKMARGIKDIHFDFSNLTFVGCLNDGWEGGDLVFPRQNLRVKLKKGDIIIFPAGLTHPHYVDVVTSGHRIVIVGQSLYPEQDHKVQY